MTQNQKTQTESERSGELFTPGPWAIDRKSHNDWRIVGTGLPGPTICSLSLWADAYRSEQHANARLISSAPDLLAACEFVMKFARMREMRGDALPSQLTIAVSAAIAKALGNKSEGSGSPASSEEGASNG